MTDATAFLKSLPPFDLLSEQELDIVLQIVEWERIAREEMRYQQHKTKLSGVDVIYRGSYEAFFFNSDGRKVLPEELGAGSTYGASSILVNKSKSIMTVQAKAGTEILRIPRDHFRRLCKANEGFYQYFISEFGREMLNDQFAHFVSPVQLDVDALNFDRYFVRRLDTIRPSSILSAAPDTPAYQAAHRMEEARISCLFIEEDQQYSGYVTDIILRNKIIGERRPTDTPIREIMEGPVYSIGRDAYVYEAILMMFQRKIRYLLLADEGVPTAVISRNKLLSDQAESPFVFIQSVRLAKTVDELTNKWAEVPELAFHLLSRGVKSELVNEIITNISDTIALKVIEGVLEEIGQPPARFVFMALGSEGRKEQTLKTDQDNAIIYEDKANEFRERTRKYFLHFATLVDDRLNAIGFSWCSGGLMAKNPKWTHSLSHWKRNYDKWIEQPNPESVMNFSTFFDCRLIYGEAQLIEELQAHIVRKLDRAGQLFFKQLADNALQYEPPLTFFRGIRTMAKGDQKVFNIKRAMTPIVDLVRVYALQQKILRTNTGERLQALREQGVFTEEDYHELMQAYYYLMGMRLRYQAQQIIFNQQEPHNYISPDALTKIELVTLKEIFRVIGKFQQRIRIIFTRTMF